jgi:hypothetical protein
MKIFVQTAFVDIGCVATESHKYAIGRDTEGLSIVVTADIAVRLEY